MPEQTSNVKKFATAKYRAATRPKLEYKLLSGMPISVLA